MSSSESRLDLRPDHLTLVQDILRSTNRTAGRCWHSDHVQPGPHKSIPISTLPFWVKSFVTSSQFQSLLKILEIPTYHSRSMSSIGQEWMGPFRNIIQLDNVVVQLATGDDWQTKTLGEAVTLQRGFDLPVAKRTLGSYPVIASTGSSWGLIMKLQWKGLGSLLVALVA